MQCPVCDAKLSRVAYETHPVYQCPECRGYLATRTKVSMIKSSRDRPAEALEEEAAQEERADSSVVLHCPKCQAAMTKRKMPIQPSIGESFAVDACRRCNVVWFDGGELARLQLDYEERPQAVEELGAQRRLQDRTAGERERFEELLAALPRSPTFLERALGEMPLIVLLAGSFVAVLLCYFLYFLAFLPVWPTIVAGVVFAAALVWLLLRTV